MLFITLTLHIYISIQGFDHHLTHRVSWVERSETNILYLLDFIPQPNPLPKRVLSLGEPTVGFALRN